MTIPEQTGAGVPFAAPQSRIWLLSTLAAGSALLLLTAIPDPTQALYEAGWWSVAVVFAGFIVSEPMVFHVEARNEAVSFSPSEIPLAFGLLLLSPQTLLIVRIGAAAIALAHWRRPPPFKLGLNLAAFAVETVVAVAVLRTVVGAGAGVGPALWAGLIASLLAGLVAGGVTIATAISFFEGSFTERVRKEFTHSYLFYLPGAVLGASTTTPYLVDKWLVLVFVLPAPLVWLVLRSHGSLMHRYVDLSQIHAFSSQVGRSTHLGDIAETAVKEISGHLRAATVALVVYDEAGRMVEASLGNRGLLDALPDGPDDGVWWARIQSPTLFTVNAQSNDPLARSLGDAGIEDAIVVPLADDTDSVGVLVVADRRGAVKHFDAHDLERLRPLSQQLTVALRKGQLHVQIQHKALHDRLTGLPNRAYFDAWVGQCLSTAGGQRAAVLMIDLDRFKEVNDTLGHHAGDQLLIEVTNRLLNVVDDAAMVARFGGDEFAVFAPHVREGDIHRLAEDISEALEEPIALKGTSVAIAGSIGVAFAPDHGTDSDTLLRRADMAMYEAKRRHERSEVFRPEFEGSDSVRLALLGDLRGALSTGTIAVHFQPQMDLRSEVVHSVEALARWQHPAHGEITPDIFIPLAEQAGLIGRLTQHVLDEALDAARHWLDNGDEIGVAVNVSAQSLLNESLPRAVSGSLRRAGVPAHLLTLEITEGAMIGDSSRTKDVLEHLDQLGVRISVDDFGTGYSSMMNLRHLPISELKIDRSFVSEMLVGSNDRVIVSSAVDLGHNLGMSVVAEGVETREVEAQLRALGCDLAQGYGICRPLPLDKLDLFLDSAATRATPPGPSRTRTTPLAPTPSLSQLGPDVAWPRSP